MAEIVFYEKPGCINGEKQKKILIEAGNTLICRDILSTAWSREALCAFLSSKDPSDIMNHTAPDIKNGRLVPARLDFDEAIALMIETPILIRRPLIEVDHLKLQGFDHEKLEPYLGNWDGEEDVITCANLAALSCDEKGKE